MNETALIQNEADQPEVEESEAVEYSVEEIKKTYYSSAQLADAQTYLDTVTAIAEQHELDVVMNFDQEKEFPQGYGLAVIPTAKRVDGENTVVGVAIAAIPDMATVQNHEGGNEFIENAVISNMMAKLANSVRPRGDAGETAASIPFAVEDFITSNRPEGVLLAFRTFAGAYVKVLKKKGLKFITESILRQVLQSAAFAEQQFPSISQDKWTKILDNMIARAEQEKLPVGMLQEWKQSRDSAELPTKDVDLSDLDFDAI